MAHPFPTLSLINRAVITLGPIVRDVEYVVVVVGCSGSSAVGGRDGEDGRSVASSPTTTGDSLLPSTDSDGWAAAVWRWER
jgi:hypothetical protein